MTDYKVIAPNGTEVTVAMKGTDGAKFKQGTIVNNEKLHKAYPKIFVPVNGITTNKPVVLKEVPPPEVIEQAPVVEPEDITEESVETPVTVTKKTKKSRKRK